jgi:hypothetical protein
MAASPYKPLETPTTIRLAILPSNNCKNKNVRIEIGLRHVELSEVHRKYSALSYVWGDPARVHNIRVNGQDYGVTENLMFFLRRPREHPMLFWIDAICINQDDLQEKSVQIQLMKQIYENASDIHAELGPATEVEERVCDQIMQISKAVDEEMSRLCEFRGIPLFEKMRVPFVDTYESEVWQNIGRFLARPLWSRVWVMQEATAQPRNTHFYYGNASLPFTDIESIEVGLSIVLNRAALNIRLHSLERVTSIAKLRHRQRKPYIHRHPLLRVTSADLRRRQRKVSPDLLDILELFRGLDTSDPRDLVYAALNLGTDIAPGGIVPDYNKSVSEVYRDVAVYYLNNLSTPLDLLGHCGNRFGSPENFASWTPQWIFKRPAAIFQKDFVSRDGARTRTYDACCSRLARFLLDLKTLKSPRAEGGILFTKGLCVDRISSVSPALDFNVELASSPDFIEDWVPADGDTPYLTGETKMQAFLRTLVADSNMDPLTFKVLCRGGQAKWDDSKNKLAVGVDGSNVVLSSYYTIWRRLSYSEKGYMALVSHQAQIGDLIFILCGGSMLYVLRPKGDNFILIGECYVHGLMDGEAIEILGLTQLEEVRIA